MFFVLKMIGKICQSSMLLGELKWQSKRKKRADQGFRFLIWGCLEFRCEGWQMILRWILERTPTPIFDCIWSWSGGWVFGHLPKNFRENQVGRICSHFDLYQKSFANNDCCLHSFDRKAKWSVVGKVLVWDIYPFQSWSESVFNQRSIWASYNNMFSFCKA